MNSENIKPLLEKRRLIKKKKPHFIRQDINKKKRLKVKWKRPRGMHSKMRLRKSGHRRCIEVGWSSPTKVSGLSRDGLKLVTVARLADLAKVNPKKDKIIITSSVGLKNRIEIIKKALELTIAIHNYKEPKKFLDNATENFRKKKEENQKKITERESKRETAKKEAEKKKKEAEKKKDEEKNKEEPSEEEKREKTEEEKAQEKKEKDKILISTQ